MESSAAALAAGAADIIAPMPADGADSCGAWIERACASRLSRCSSAQRLKRSEISWLLAKACSVFFGAACAALTVTRTMAVNGGGGRTGLSPGDR